MQYFERAVFEYHPEQTDPPYQVLLSQLGTFQYRQKYPDGRTRPASRTRGRLPCSSARQATASAAGSCNYWQTHGGLAQQGFPISDEFTET